MPRKFVPFVLSLLLVFLAGGLFLSSAARVPQTGATEAILKASDITPKIFPPTVFFRGQTAPVQMRNTAGVHFADGFYFLAGLVDNSGYSSGVREKYQGYLITEVSLEIGGQSLKPGAYGFGYLSDGKFVVLDLGNNELLQTPSQRDAEIKHPVPFQILAAPNAGNYRLYNGRDFVEFHRVH
jgi:hypothetical protein